MERMVTVEFMFLVMFIMSSLTFASAAGDAIVCPGNSTVETESTAMSVLSLCSTHLNASLTLLEEGVQVLSLDGTFFHHEIPIEILEDDKFWVTYCRDWPQFEGCALDAVKNCTSSEIDHLRTEVKTQVLRAWRSIGLFPVPVVEKWACNGPEVSDRLKRVYAYETTKGCDFDSVRKCLVDWHEDLQSSGFLESMDGSQFNETNWLIRHARLTLNCSLMSLKPCSSQKVVEFVKFVIKQSLPLEIANQVIEFDDVDRHEELDDVADNGSKTSSSSSFLQTSKSFYNEVWILFCFVQSISLVLRETVVYSNTVYDVI